MLRTKTLRIILAALLALGAAGATQATTTAGGGLGCCRDAI